MRDEYITSDQDDRQFLYEERAAIMQYEAGLEREEAERLAWLDVYGEPPSS